jgi:AcrR family transcriptional regulator
MTRPGGRSARVRAAVHRAAIELLVEGETDAAIPRIAERAGVHPTSVYRRWGSRENVLLDAAVTRMREQSPMPETGSLRGDLLAWAAGVERAMTEPDGHVLLRALVATMSAPERSREHLWARGEDLRAMLDAATARGEAAPSVEDVIDHVLAPIYVRALFGVPARPSAVLVDRLLATTQPAGARKGDF